MNNQFKMIIFAILSILFFCFLIPLSFFFNYPVIISILGGLIGGFFLALSLLNISTIDEIYSIDEKEESKNFYTILFPFIGFIVFGFIIYTINNNRIDSKIDKEGIFTEGNIENGEQITKVIYTKR